MNGGYNMTKKELVSDILEIKNNKNTDIYYIDKTGYALNYHLTRRLIFDTIMFSLLLIVTIILNNKISKLSFISPNVYYIMLGCFIVFLVLAMAFLYLNFFYRNAKSILYTKEFVIKTHYCYEVYDVLSFILKAFFIIYAIIMFALTPALVSGSSMNNTYRDNDRVLVWHLGYQPKNNDVIIIDATTNHYQELREETAFLIKRVIASPGDKISFTPGKLYVNDILVHEESSFDLDKYKNMLKDHFNGVSYYQEKEVILPQGFYIAMGDNRINSCDSRAIGLIHEEDILGKSIFRVYPFDKIGIPSKSIIYKK